MQFVQYQTEAGIGRITLNRPEKRNALNAEYVSELKEAFKIAEADDQCKVIILQANGAAFSAGADLAYLQTLQNNTFEENYADSTHLKELFYQIYTLQKVVIAQIEGHAIAGGCGLATVCDFSFAVPEAMFGYTETKIGFIPAIVKVFLLRKIGEGKAKELLLKGDLFYADAAKEYGLINEVVTNDRIQKHVTKFAQQLCSQNSGDSLRLTKQMIAQVQEMTLEEGLDHAAKMNAEARATADCKAGISAFLNKEKINWN